MLGCPDVTRRACMCQCKCPNQLAWTLNWLYPASSQVQSLFNVWLSPCLNRGGHCQDTHTHSRVYFTIIQIIMILFAESTTLQTPAAWWGAVGHSTHASYIRRCWTTTKTSCRHFYIQCLFDNTKMTCKTKSTWQVLTQWLLQLLIPRGEPAEQILRGADESQQGSCVVNQTWPYSARATPQTNTGTLMHIQNYNNKHFQGELVNGSYMCIQSYTLTLSHMHMQNKQGLKAAK